MLVDDHTMVRRGLATFLKVFMDLQLVGEAERQPLRGLSPGIVFLIGGHGCITTCLNSENLPVNSLKTSVFPNKHSP